VRYKDDPTEMVSSLLGPVETSNLLRKSKPAFFALQELSVMVASCERQLPHYVLMGMQQQPQNLDEVRTAMKKLRIVILRFGTATENGLERWTNPKPLGTIVDRAAF
jgi:hypothetical protein